MGKIAERQGALAALGRPARPGGRRAARPGSTGSRRGQVPPEVSSTCSRPPPDEPSSTRGRREAPPLSTSRRPQDDPLAPYRESLAGGDAARGEAIFVEKAEVSCVRCHKVGGKGARSAPT